MCSAASIEDERRETGTTGACAEPLLLPAGHPADIVHGC
jgi:hypothetical protein